MGSGVGPVREEHGIMLAAAKAIHFSLSLSARMPASVEKGAEGSLQETQGTGEFPTREQHGAPLRGGGAGDPRGP